MKLCTVAIVAMLAAAVAAQGGSPCLLESTRLEGQPIEHSEETSSSDDCSALCQGKEECLGWTFRLETSDCSLTSDYEADAFKHEAGYTTGLIRGRTNLQPFDGVIIFANALGYRPRKKETLDQCIKYCRRKCNFVTYDAANKQCLKWQSFEELAHKEGTVTAAKACKSEENCEWPGVEVGGTTEDTINLVSKSDCQKKCKDSSTCKAWVYDAFEIQCQLKSEYAATDIKYTGLKISGFTDLAPSQKFTIQDAAPTEVGGERVKDFTEKGQCKVACDGKEWCNYWRFQNWGRGKACLLSRSFDGIIVRKRQVDSGVKGCDSNKCILPNVKLSADQGTTTSVATNWQDCQSKCDLKEDCSFWEWGFVKGKQCTLGGSHFDTMEASYSKVSGLKWSRLVETWPLYRIRLVGGTVLKRVKKQSLQECEQACKDDDQCVYWVHKYWKTKPLLCELRSSYETSSRGRYGRYVSGSKGCPSA